MTQPLRVKKAARKCIASLLIGDTVKLRGPPKAFATKLALKKVSGRVNSPGYSKNVKDVTMGNPQPSPKDASLWMQFND
jgi:hypothetical protein